MNNHENCHHLLKSLSDYIDGDLEDEICQEIERHVADCEDCRIVIDTLEKTVSLYRDTAEEPIVPSDVRERLYHRLDLDSYLSDANEDSVS
jgi:anti-sigma factor (TIGR02949 family)